MDKPITIVIESFLILILFLLHLYVGPMGMIFIGTAFGMLASQVWLAFAAGFISIFSFWSFMAYIIDFKQKFFLAPVIAPIFNLSKPWMPYLITGLVGALPCGMIAITVCYFKKAIIRN